jgi:hypothetical protein
MRSQFLTVLACILASASASAADTKTGKNKFGPRDVELRLHDGSIIRGEIKQLENIALKTEYGTLTYPLSDMMRITRGKRMAAEEVCEVESAIKDLDSDNFDKRRAAQTKLEYYGISAAVVLEQCRKTASTEAKNRIDAILKKIMADGPRPQTEDVVRAGKFEAIGIVDIDVLNLGTRFGDLKIKFQDVELLRWLASGSASTVTLEAVPGMKDWYDTGIDVTSGEPVSFQCTGNLNLFGSNQCGPSGSRNWGNRYPFHIGAVVAKFGASGTPFLVGDGTKKQPTTSERLFVKLFCSDDIISSGNFEQCTGSIQVSLGTGSWAEFARATGRDSQ